MRCTEFRTVSLPCFFPRAPKHRCFGWQPESNRWRAARAAGAAAPSVLKVCAQSAGSALGDGTSALRTEVMDTFEAQAFLGKDLAPVGCAPPSASHSYSNGNEVAVT